MDDPLNEEIKYGSFFIMKSIVKRGEEVVTPVR